MKTKAVPINQAETSLAELIEQVEKTSEPVYISKDGQVRAVLLSKSHYQGLIELLEDLDDTVEAQMARLDNEPTISLEEFERQIASERATRTSS